MRFLLYGSSDDYTQTIKCQDMVSELQYRRIECTHASDFDTFLDDLRQNTYDFIVVTMNGAEGMEGVIAVQKIKQNIDIVWFSDDAGFGVQAHRFGCAYFSVKPITEESISKAYHAIQELRQSKWRKY